MYRQVLNHYAILSGKRLIGNGLEVFQHHDDLKHTANASEIIFGEKNGEKIGCILIKTQINIYGLSLQPC